MHRLPWSVIRSIMISFPPPFWKKNCAVSTGLSPVRLSFYTKSTQERSVGNEHFSGYNPEGVSTPKYPSNKISPRAITPKITKCTMGPFFPDDHIIRQILAISGNSQMEKFINPSMIPASSLLQTSEELSVLLTGKPKEVCTISETNHKKAKTRAKIATLFFMKQSS
jgi:hypothetical protein